MCENCILQEKLQVGDKKGDGGEKKTHAHKRMADAETHRVASGKFKVVQVQEKKGGDMKMNANGKRKLDSKSLPVPKKQASFQPTVRRHILTNDISEIRQRHVGISDICDAFQIPSLPEIQPGLFRRPIFHRSKRFHRP